MFYLKGNYSYVLLTNWLKDDVNVRTLVKELETSVYNGEMTSGKAADIILKQFMVDQSCKEEQ